MDSVLAQRSPRRAQRRLKDLKLEVGDQRAPRLLVLLYFDIILSNKDVVERRYALIFICVILAKPVNLV